MACACSRCTPFRPAGDDDAGRVVSQASRQEVGLPLLDDDAVVGGIDLYAKNVVHRLGEVEGGGIAD